MELCFKNISQSDSEEFITTNEDLEGFWDMVLIQVIDIRQTFDEITKLYQNGWKLDIPKEMTFSPIKSSKKSTPKASPNKSKCETSPLNRDIERKNRIKEAKRRQAKLMAAKSEDEITIFTSTSKE